MNNFKSFITIFAFVGFFGSSISIKAGINSVQPSEQCKVIISSIKEMSAKLDISDAKALYIEYLEQTIKKMCEVVSNLDWTSFKEALKNKNNNLAGQELTKITKKVLEPLSLSCEGTLMQAVCLSCITQKDSEVSLKITNAMAQCVGQYFTKLANQELPQAEDDAMHFINIINTSLKELFNSMLTVTRNVLYNLSSTL